MIDSKEQLWKRFQKYYRQYPELGLALDISRMNFSDDFLSSLAAQMNKAFQEMEALEKGAIANKDENRMVGHYWLRNPSLAPTPEIRKEIESTVSEIKAFASDIHSGKIHSSKGPFKNVLVIGIGGSALGPQFVANALTQPHSDKLLSYFLDNTDPDGIDKTLSYIGAENLAATLVIVISKSGGTMETRNGMIETEAAYRAAGLAFSEHAVAVTSAGSQLDKTASDQKWIRRFPMWDWVGGRTSELSAVGLLPAALQGFDIDSLLQGAKTCDEVTRKTDLLLNPAALLAAMWLYIGNGKGQKNMVVLPYKDRLELFSKYLQQLVMESLGKATDRAGKVVHQGITVLGNKGSTDQHSYVQQLRDGLDNFFVTFVEVLKDRNGASIEVEPGVTSGDYLEGFFQGTRTALYENGRESITITITEVKPFAIGVLIALFERVVGLYASLIDINAYHQPGVEAGKKAAANVIQVQGQILRSLSERPDQLFSPDELASGINTGQRPSPETVFRIARHLAANGRLKEVPGNGAEQSRFGILPK